ncbi:FIST signal transduction protein [Algoriphagus limi]|uniref:FIST C-terminal domain-containing protein n=1 Tax=Algoriphagus limi TaxID=2975273 RepID=A0ABT2G988_9BACT|nr:FIST N-terminal domain-containing protein [Algoriphagus limi]MCS5491318.1 FIST C-terminal domain-containing protein [Algoriphagus limi]
MKAKSIFGKTPEEIQKALEASLADGFNPSIAVVFISVKQDRNAVCEILSHQDIDVFGATSCGEFVNGHQSSGEIAILLMDLAREAYSIVLEEIGTLGIKEVAKKVANSALTQFQNPSMIICSTGVTPTKELFEGASLVDELSEALGRDKIFFGGMAGDDFTINETTVFTQTRETNHGLVALVLDSDRVAFSGMAITGWKKLGISRVVTKCKGKILYSIDNKPAVDMYLKYLGKGEKSGEKDFDVLNELSFEFPFITNRENSDEILIKSPMGIDFEENALVMDMEMKEGETFWFSEPPSFDIVEEIIEEAKEVKTTADGDADALLIFSCAGREPALGPLVTMENEGLAKVWNSPMAGFFTYGEFGRAKNGQQHVHSTACCWVALKEK